MLHFRHQLLFEGICNTIVNEYYRTFDGKDVLEYNGKEPLAYALQLAQAWTAEANKIRK
jgi:hypothetical protein